MQSEGSEREGGRGEENEEILKSAPRTSNMIPKEERREGVTLRGHQKVMNQKRSPSREAAFSKARSSGKTEKKIRRGGQEIDALKKNSVAF